MGAAVQSVARHPRCYRTLPYGASVYLHIRSGCDIACAQERDPVFVGGPDADRERAVRERFEPYPGRAPPRYAKVAPLRPERLRALGISHGFAHRVLARKRLRIAYTLRPCIRVMARVKLSVRARPHGTCFRASPPAAKRSRRVCERTLMASNIVPRRCSCAPHRSQGAPRDPGTRETVPTFAWARR